MIEILRNSKKIIWFKNKIQRSSHTSTKHTILFLFTHNATHSVRLIFVSLLEMLCVMLCVNLSEIAVCCALCELIRNTVWTYQKCCVWVYLKCCGTEEDDLHNYFNPLLTKLHGWKGYQNVRTHWLIFCWFWLALYRLCVDHISHWVDSVYTLNCSV